MAFRFIFIPFLSFLSFASRTMLNLAGQECCEANFKVLNQLFKGLCFLMFEVIHQTRKKSVSSGYPNSGKWVEKKTRRRRAFLPTSRCLDT